jgi:hypothetical protein
LPAAVDQVAAFVTFTGSTPTRRRTTSFTSLEAMVVCDAENVTSVNVELEHSGFYG